MWMISRNRSAILISFVLSATFLVSCTSYKSREVAFRHPSAYANFQSIAGAQLAAEAYAQEEKAKETFGFNIRDAGLLPVQIVLDNSGNNRLQIVPEQTFLIDEQGGMWNLLESRTAYERLEKSSEYARISRSAGRGGLLGATGGALVGAAIGILAGENVGEAALKGGALGGAGGAVIGGGSELSSEEGARQISRDLANKELKNKVIEPGSLARGFLFFPGEAPSAKVLRLQVKEMGSGQTHTLMLPL